MLYWQMFLSFVEIGLFSIGGGYAAIPLIQSQVVTLHQWLTLSEFTDLVTIAEMTPGPIAVNSATFVGIRLAGIPGAIVATAGCILPSCILVTLLSVFYRKYGRNRSLQTVLGTLRPAVVALIASATIGILSSALFLSRSVTPANFSLPALILLCAAFFVLRKSKVSPILVMFGTGLLFFCYQLLTGAIQL